MKVKRSIKAGMSISDCAGFSKGAERSRQPILSHLAVSNHPNHIHIDSDHARGPNQSHEGDVLYADCARLVPFWPCSELCAGLDGDHDGDVGLYAGEADTERHIKVSEIAWEISITFKPDIILKRVFPMPKNTHATK